jgi:hypothetical protein
VSMMKRLALWFCDIIYQLVITPISRVTVLLGLSGGKVGNALAGKVDSNLNAA